MLKLNIPFLFEEESETKISWLSIDVLIRIMERKIQSNSKHQYKILFFKTRWRLRRIFILLIQDSKVFVFSLNLVHGS